MIYTQQTLVISLGQNLKLTQCLTFSELCCVPKYGQYYAMLCYAMMEVWAEPHFPKLTEN
jgi:hypothetical protein